MEDIDMKEEDIDELLDFFKFSVKDSHYKGHVEFNLSSGGKEMQRFSVSVSKDEGEPIIKTYKNDEIPKDQVTCVVSLSGRDLRKIYLGTYTSTQIATMCFSQAIQVHRFRYSELTAFAACFEFSSSAWDNFYKFKRSIPPPLSLQEKEEDDEEEESEKRVEEELLMKDDGDGLYGYESEEGESEGGYDTFEEFHFGGDIGLEEEKADPKEVLRILKGMYSQSYKRSTSLSFGSLVAYRECNLRGGTSLNLPSSTILNAINQSLSKISLSKSPVYISPPQSVEAVASMKYELPKFSSSLPHSPNTLKFLHHKKRNSQWERRERYFHEEFNEIDKELIHEVGHLKEAAEEIQFKIKSKLDRLRTPAVLSPSWDRVDDLVSNPRKAGQMFRKVLEEKSFEIKDLILNKKEESTKKKESFESPQFGSITSLHNSSFWD